MTSWSVFQVVMRISHETYTNPVTQIHPQLSGKREEDFFVITKSRFGKQSVTFKLAQKAPLRRHNVVMTQIVSLGREGDSLGWVWFAGKKGGAGSVGEFSSDWTSITRDVSRRDFDVTAVRWRPVWKGFVQRMVGFSHSQTSLSLSHQLSYHHIVPSPGSFSLCPVFLTLKNLPSLGVWLVFPERFLSRTSSFL